MADETTVLVNIGEMIDLAIGTPEVGVVDFNMLQTVLHCIAQQLKVLGKNVELRGSAAALTSGRENSQTIVVSEFVVDTEDGQPKENDEVHTMLVVERIKKREAKSAAASKEPRPTPAAPFSDKRAVGTSPARPGIPSSEKLKLAEGTSPALPGIPSSEKLSLVTQSKFNLLEKTVLDLKNRVYGSMPNNEEILEEVRSQTNLKAITDMWTSLNVSSRLEAAENGISKLSSLVQDLIAAGADDPAATEALKKALGGMRGAGGAPGSPTGKHPADIVIPNNIGPEIQEALVTIKSSLEQQKAEVDALAYALNNTLQGLQSGANDLRKALSGMTGAGGAPGSPTGKHPADIVIPNNIGPEIQEALVTIKSSLGQQKAEVDALANALYNTLQGLQSGAYAMAGAQEAYAAPGFADAPGTAAIGAPGMAGAQEAYAAPGFAGAPGTAGSPEAYIAADGIAVVDGKPVAPGIPAATPGRQGGMGGPQAGHAMAALGDKMMEMEKRLKHCCDTIDKRTGALNDKFSSIQDQLDHYMKQGASLASSDLASGKLSPELIKELQGLMSLFHTVQDMEQQLKKVHETALQLAAEKEDRDLNINTLLEQIELLKVIKLDREDMVEAMADKADLRMLARKVSHDQFEMACDDLSKGLEHALGKLNLQEALWQQALDDIQREIETKLDKMELSPVKEFFNSKLKQLQDNLKQMASLRREAEAAGTKRKLLRDVNCLSCDAQAVMAMEVAPTVPASKPLPATLSMKPYLSYELDAIRKSHASNMPQRNMRDWETIDKQMASAVNKQHKVRSGSNKHLCNRYCGGSHTVTTPAQRVARLGHFVKQWGPDVLPLSSGLAAGDDGRMYRISPIEGQAVGPGGVVEGPATPKTPTKKPEQKASKPLIVSNECRCMESEAQLK